MTTFAYLWIADTLRQFASEELISDKIKDGVKGISVIGTIVNSLCSPSNEAFNSNTRRLPFVFEIDDGTAVIKVVYFCPSQPKQLADSSNLAHKVTLFCDIRNIVKVGKTIEVKGVPQIYTENVEIKAYEVRQVLDPNDEVDRMLLVDRWRKECDWF